ncbi:hypothetical protein EOD41_12215 [Mucilaginibacter limnophilus]|uniref:Uncharacterized protein n=1 Tax=Mucilaginibacter limnophilus TaxID=1932778 RepID=A0A3S2UKZ9_9SPHI|nr:hypothetical protein [Mucilaginibacter limnophilus]RVU00750.1 hypothetical protein EOD41_12215 [Mucilaginibacter limnophilus]
MSNYLISIPNAESVKSEVIHDPKSKLKVKVFDILKSRFQPSQGEVRFFVTANDEVLAFETRGYKKHRELLILQMISWYCSYLGLFEARIHPNWP